MANQYKTYKDILNFQKKNLEPSKSPSFVDKLMLGLMRNSLVGNFFVKNDLFFTYSLKFLQLSAEWELLFTIIIRRLSSSRFQKKHSMKWWRLMRVAVSVLQNWQLTHIASPEDSEDKLILLGILGPRPLKGYDVAYVFLSYSLWYFERGNIFAAIEFIQIAIHADETWGYPHYLLGWYGLMSSGVDSSKHFLKAVSLDWSFLHRIKQDASCRKYPAVIHKVQQGLVLVGKTAI